MKKTFLGELWVMLIGLVAAIFILGALAAPIVAPLLNAAPAADTVAEPLSIDCDIYLILQAEE